MSLRINDVTPPRLRHRNDAGASPFSRVDRPGMAIHTSAFCAKPASNNPKNHAVSSRMHVCRLGGDHLAKCDD